MRTVYSAIVQLIIVACCWGIVAGNLKTPVAFFFCGIVAQLAAAYMKDSLFYMLEKDGVVTNDDISDD